MLALRIALREVRRNLPVPLAGTRHVCPWRREGADSEKLHETERHKAVAGFAPASNDRSVCQPIQLRLEVITTAHHHDAFGTERLSIGAEHRYDSAFHVRRSWSYRD